MNDEDRVLRLVRGAAAPLGERSDDELMALAVEGVRAAFTELMRRHQAGVRAFCQRWDPARGDDLAQEVFVALWCGRARYVPRGQFRVYLYTLVRNRCRNAWRDFWRRAKRDVNAVAEEGTFDEGQLVALLARERDQRVQRAISGLRPKLREAVLLRYGEGLRHAEIAEIVGVPEVTVRSRVFLGLAALRESLGGMAS